MVQSLSQARTTHMHCKQIEAVHEVITCTLYGVCKRLVAKLLRVINYIKMYKVVEY